LRFAFCVGAFFLLRSAAVQYGCCGIESSTEADGVVTSYLYDDMKRLTTTSRIAPRDFHLLI
jgi:hypothetical protein